MTKRNEVYRCTVCGNITEVLHPSDGTLVCCGKEMRLMKENTEDGAREKHVPVIEPTEGGYVVRVGEVEHPMIEKHYIEWIELADENNVQRKYLKPGEKPEAMFLTDSKNVKAREYCNLHGLWASNSSN